MPRSLRQDRRAALGLVRAVCEEWRLAIVTPGRDPGEAGKLLTSLRRTVATARERGLTRPRLLRALCEGWPGIREYRVREALGD